MTTSHVPAAFMARARALVSAAGCFVLLALASCTGDASEPPARLLYSVQGSTMGTYYVVKVVVPNSAAETAGAAKSGAAKAEAEGASQPTPDERILPLIEEELAHVDELMSNYRADSELSRFNAWKSTEPFPISPDTAKVFASALELGELTDGALDITVGPLVEAWGFGPQGEAVEPPSQDLLVEILLTQVGLEHLHLDVEAGTLTKDVPELSCDLSSLAKGFGVDRVLERLVAEGYDNVLVEIGGEVRTVGRNVEGEEWRLGIERPFAVRGQVQRIVGLDGEALATSGDYRNYREVDGRRVSHLIDPRRGQPIGNRVASVSVVDSTCMRADALATALMVLGEDKGFELAEREGLAALFLVRSGDTFLEHPSAEFAARFMHPEEVASE